MARPDGRESPGRQTRGAVVSLRRARGKIGAAQGGLLEFIPLHTAEKGHMEAGGALRSGTVIQVSRSCDKDHLSRCERSTAGCLLRATAFRL